MKVLLNLVWANIIILLLISCGSSKDAAESSEFDKFIAEEKNSIRNNVKDTVKIKQMFIIVDEAVDSAKNFNDRRTFYTDDFLNQLDDYNSTKEELSKYAAHALEELKETLLYLLEQDAELKTLSTSEEWKEISK